MKTRISSTISLVACLLLLLTGCGSSAPGIEDQVWQLGSLSQISEGSEPVVLYSADTAEDPAPLTCAAQQGNFTLTDSRDGTKYQGSYQVMDRSSSGTGYSLTLGDTSGMAMVSYTKYASGESVPTLVLQLDEYLFYFQ